MLETVVCVALLSAREIPALTVPHNSVSRRQGWQQPACALSWKKYGCKDTTWYIMNY